MNYLFLLLHAGMVALWWFVHLEMRFHHEAIKSTHTSIMTLFEITELHREILARNHGVLQ